MKYFIYLMYVYILIIFFIPKDKIYYSIEKELNSNNIYINEKEINNNLFSLKIKDSSFILNQNEIFKIENFDFNTWIFYNSLKFEKISVNENFKLLFPGNINTINVVYNVLNPFEVTINGIADFGKFEGYYNIEEEKIFFIIEENQEIKKYPLLIKNLHKKNGVLIYEKSFK